MYACNNHRNYIKLIFAMFCYAKCAIYSVYCNNIILINIVSDPCLMQGQGGLIAAGLTENKYFCVRKIFCVVILYRTSEWKKIMSAAIAHSCVRMKMILGDQFCHKICFVSFLFIRKCIFFLYLLLMNKQRSAH
jgi:hypothetical protein